MALINKKPPTPILIQSALLDLGRRVAVGKVLKVMLAMGLLDQTDSLFSLEGDPDLLRYAQNALSKAPRHGWPCSGLGLATRHRRTCARR